VPPPLADRPRRRRAKAKKPDEGAVAIADLTGADLHAALDSRTAQRVAIFRDFACLYASTLAHPARC